MSDCKSRQRHTDHLWWLCFLCFDSIPFSRLSPTSPSEGDLSCQSVSTDDTGPIRNTSCKLCISQMLLAPSGGWSVRHACFVQYANNHMQITCLCVPQYISVDANAMRYLMCVRRFKWVAGISPDTVKWALTDMGAWRLEKNVIITGVHFYPDRHGGQKLKAAPRCAATRGIL